MWKIKDIVITSIVTALAIVFGMFANIKFLNDRVYLLPIILYTSVLILKMHMLSIATIFSVIISDLYTGFISYTWISLIAYLPCMLFIRFCYSKNKKYGFFIGVFIGSFWMIIIFYLLQLSFFSKSQAIGGFFATSLQCAISIFVSFFLYYPILRLKKEIL